MIDSSGSFQPVRRDRSKTVFDVAIRLNAYLQRQTDPVNRSCILATRIKPSRSSGMRLVLRFRVAQRRALMAPVPSFSTGSLQPIQNTIRSEAMLSLS